MVDDMKAEQIMVRVVENAIKEFGLSNFKKLPMFVSAQRPQRTQIAA